MSTSKETAIVITLYYIIVIAGKEMMRKRPAFKLNTFFMVHNLYLTIISGALLLLFIEQVSPIIWRNGVYYSICGCGGWTRQLETLYFVR